MTTRWHPDTCACVFDLDASGNPAVVVNRCARHLAAANPLGLIASENRTKNAAQAILDAAGANYTWSFTVGGTLQIHTVGANAAQKSTWTTAITPKATVPFTVL